MKWFHASLSSAAKLTKYLECKHEEASLLAMCRGARLSSDRFARNFASSKESLRIRRRCHGVPLSCHFSDTNTPRQPPTTVSPRDSFQNSPSTDLTVSTTLYNVNPNRQSRPLPKISAPRCIGPKSNLTNSGEAQRGRSYKNLSIKDRMPMVRAGSQTPVPSGIVNQKRLGVHS